MASVYNSSTTAPFFGRWEDVQSYTSILITIKGINSNTTVEVNWINSIDDSPPKETDLPLCTDSFNATTEVITKEFSTRCRWVRIKIGGPSGQIKLATVYKKAPTAIKLSDDTTNIVSVNLGDTKNSLYTVLTDMSGATLRSTGKNQKGNALYTHLADGSGKSLATTETYKFIGTYDTSHYTFLATNEVNAQSKLDSDTIIFHEGTLRLNSSRIGVKHKDIVRFVMLRSNDSTTTGIGARNLEQLFIDTNNTTSTNITTTSGGHIMFKGQVQYVEADASFARIKILTQANTSNWFNPDIGFNNDLGTIKSYANMKPNSKRWVKQTGGIYSFIDSSAMDKDASLGGHYLGGALFPSPDDFYNVVADASGIGRINGVAISGENYQYPLDPRLIRWSQSVDTLVKSLENSGTAIMQVVKRADIKESLCVALRDSCNNSLASTGAGVTTYRTDSRTPPVKNILYFVDATGYLPKVGTAQVELDASKVASLNNILTNFVVPLANVVAATSPASQSTVILYDGSSSAVSAGISAIVSSAVATNFNGTNFNTNLIITGAADFMSALGAYVKGNVGNVDNEPDRTINTVIVVSSGNNNLNTSQNDDQSFDACFNSYYGKMRRIALCSYRRPDLLNFTSGDPNNFFLLKSTYDNRTQFQTDISGIALKIAEQLTKTAFVGHNALAVHTADARGHSQAATGKVKDSTFGDVALYYSLSDACGSTITSTRTASDTCNNALYVTLTDGSGKSISQSNGLYIAMMESKNISYGFDISLGGKLTTFTDISNVKSYSGATGFNISNFNIANETPVPVWVKIYDISSTGVTAGLSSGPSAAGLLPYLKYNFAVPATDYRDLQFSKPVLFTHGIYFVASTNFRYDSFDYPPGRAPIYINGTYTRVTD